MPLPAKRSATARLCIIASGLRRFRRGERGVEPEVRAAARLALAVHLAAHQRGELMLTVRTLNVRCGKRHHHPVRMMRRLLVDRIDQIERVPGEVAFVRSRIDPD